jgi:hypothetical protein
MLNVKLDRIIGYILENFRDRTKKNVEILFYML